MAAAPPTAGPADADRAPVRDAAGGTQLEELAWIDDFFGSVKDYLFLRAEDGVLILPPNRVFKLNPSGIRVLRHLSGGRSILDLPGLRPGPRAADVIAFFSNLKAFYEGRFADIDRAAAVERVPYDFHFTRLPILGEIAVTYRCNNRCLFCYAACGDERRSERDRSNRPAGAAARSRRELSTRGLRRVIRIFKREAELPFFSFTGGEPLLRRDLESLISYAVRLGLRVNLVSNGTRSTPDRARRLHDAGLRTAQISVEGPSAAVHDELTGVPGSFERTLSGIRALQAAGISVQTNTTLCRANVREAADMPAFLRERGVSRFAMNLFIPSGRGLSHDELFLPYSEIPAVIEAVRREARRNELTFYWYSPIPHCRYNPIARGLGNKSCAAMDGLLSVSPQGDVLPCSSYPEPMGNLLEQPFREIWFSRRAAWFKEKRYAPEECRRCDMFTACQAACPLYWRYAGTGEIPRGEGVSTAAPSAPSVSNAPGPAAGAQATPNMEAS